MQTHSEKINHDITISVDKVTSRLYSDLVPDRFEITERLRRRLLHECKSIAASRERIKADIDAYHRVIDEMEQVSRREKRVNSIVGVLGLDELARIYDKESELRSAINSAATVSPAKLQNSLALWEAMKEYLQHVPEAQIAEMEDFFEAVKMPNSNRQAMESALKRHPETFKIRKDKRDKFISLKSRAKEGG